MNEIIVDSSIHQAPIEDERNIPFDTITISQSDYLWPTNASRKITSSFAEYRTTHFHGGIDISTNGQKGFKVFAPRDGYVYRIVVSPNGYGKMLYVKHADGYFSAFAHLQGYNDAITRVVRDEQERRETYAIDVTLPPQQLPVKRGDVIAYTGDTGFGPPHLHFEVRDENLDQINPLLFNSLKIPDNIPPRIRRVLISPLTFGSTIDNISHPKLLTRFYGRTNEFYISQTIRVHGEIAFGLDAVDYVNGTWSRSGIHRIELYLDDSLTFASQLDKVPIRDTKLVDLHYDFPSLLYGRGHFQKLYVDAGNTLPFYEHRPEGSGIIVTDNFAEGIHKFLIVCKDAAGNKTELTGKLLFNHKPSIQVNSVEDNKISLSGNNLEPISKCIVYEKKAYDSRWSERTFTQKSFEKNTDGITLALDKKDYDVVKIIVETKTGARSDPTFFFKRKIHGVKEKINLDIELNGHATVTLSTKGMFTQPPKVVLQEGNIEKNIVVSAVDVNKYVGMFLPNDSITGTRTVSIEAEVNGFPMKAQESFDVYPIPTNRSGSFSVDDNLSVSFDSGAVFKPLYMQVTKENINGLTVYELEPTDVLLNRGIKCSLRSQNDAGDGAGLYFRATGGWNLQSSHLDESQKSFSTKLTRTLGDLTLIRDEQPPSIGRLRIQPRNRRVNVFFRYADNHAGVDPNEIKLYIDKKLAIPEIDGEHKKVTYQSDERLEKGKHTLHITMKDRMKNETELSRSFFVK